MEPLEENLDAIVMEFKVQNTAKEKSLKQTVQNALRQIEEKQYDTELLARGITKRTDQALWFCISREESSDWKLGKIQKHI